MNPRNHALTDAERARIDHLDRLVAVGGRGIRELIASLSETSWTVRRAVVAGLASLGDEAVGPLCSWLREVRSSEHAIAGAVEALSSSIGTTVVRDVIGLTEHSNPAVVADAAQILGRRRALVAAPRLAALVEHPDDNVAVAAIEALGTIGGSSAVETLVRVIERKQFFRAFPAIQVLARTGDPRAVAPLAALLSDETYRLEVVRALGRTGSVQAVGPITSLLRNPSDAIVRLVAVALADLLDRADWMGTLPHVTTVIRAALHPSLGRIAGALRSGETGERVAIVRLLGRTGDASVLPAITSMLADAELSAAATEAVQTLQRASDEALIVALATDDAARRVAILPLVRAPSAATAVRALLANEDPEVRARACEAIARIGDTGGVPLLFELLGDASARAAHAAVSAILTLGTSVTESLALHAVHSSRPSERRHAIRILGAFGFPAAFEPLRAAIDDADRRIAELAIAGLGGIDDPRVDDVLAQLASSRDSALRSAVMRAAAQRGGSIASRLLARGLSDTDEWVRYYAAQGIGRIGVDSGTEASRLLTQHLRDTAPQVRIAAIEALSRLGSSDAWDAVRHAAASTDPDERRAGLVGIGMQAREDAADILLDAARSPDRATRLVALAGLGRVARPDAVSALETALGDPSDEIQMAALSLLTERNDEHAARVLFEWSLRQEPDHPVHRALSRPAPSRVVAIVDRLATADERAAPVLVAALARMQSDVATGALFESLGLANPRARAAAATSLVALGADGAIAAVSRLATSDPEPEVRRVCAAALTAT